MEIPRFWHGLASARAEWIIPEPVVVALVYIHTFIIWLIFAFADVASFFGPRNGLGITLRTPDHTVNATVLGNLLVHLLVRFFPHHARSSGGRIPIILTTIVVATCTSRFMK